MIKICGARAGLPAIAAACLGLLSCTDRPEERGTGPVLLPVAAANGSSWSAATAPRPTALPTPRPSPTEPARRGESIAEAPAGEDPYAG